MTGPTIQIHLVDGAPDGLRRVTRSHWTGVALACSRTRYMEARTERGEYTDPGVYVLSGASDDPGYEGRIYVGEGEVPRERIDAHLAKDFWSRVVVSPVLRMASTKPSNAGHATTRDS